VKAEVAAIEPRGADARSGRRALKVLHKESSYTADTDLVFCHPDTGNPYDSSKMRKRYKEALATTGDPLAGCDTQLTTQDTR